MKRCFAVSLLFLCVSAAADERTGLYSGGVTMARDPLAPVQRVDLIYVAADEVVADVRDGGFGRLCHVNLGSPWDGVSRDSCVGEPDRVANSVVAVASDELGSLLVVSVRHFDVATCAYVDEYWTRFRPRERDGCAASDYTPWRMIPFTAGERFGAAPAVAWLPGTRPAFYVLGLQPGLTRLSYDVSYDDGATWTGWRTVPGVWPQHTPDSAPAAASFVDGAGVRRLRVMLGSGAGFLGQDYGDADGWRGWSWAAAPGADPPATAPALVDELAGSGGDLALGYLGTSGHAYLRSAVTGGWVDLGFTQAHPIFPSLGFRGGWDPRDGGWWPTFVTALGTPWWRKMIYLDAWTGWSWAYDGYALTSY